MKIEFELIMKKEMPFSCFNRITGIKDNGKWYKRNHIFGVKGIFGLIVSFLWVEQK